MNVGAMAVHGVRGWLVTTVGAAASLALVVGTGVEDVPGARAARGRPPVYTSQAPGGAATAGAKVIALTFDDGPSPYTPAVLSVLQQYGVPASFFDIGEEVANYPRVRAARRGRRLPGGGPHLEPSRPRHPAGWRGVGAQIDQTQAEIRAVTGTTPLCVRPPYNAWNSTVLSEVAARGLTTMSYSVDPRD